MTDKAQDAPKEQLIFSDSEIIQLDQKQKICMQVLRYLYHNEAGKEALSEAILKVRDSLKAEKDLMTKTVSAALLKALGGKGQEDIIETIAVMMVGYTAIIRDNLNPENLEDLILSWRGRKAFANTFILPANQATEIETYEMHSPNSAAAHGAVKIDWEKPLADSLKIYMEKSGVNGEILVPFRAFSVSLMERFVNELDASLQARAFPSSEGLMYALVSPFRGIESRFVQNKMDTYFSAFNEADFSGKVQKMAEAANAIPDSEVSIKSFSREICRLIAGGGEGFVQAVCDRMNLTLSKYAEEIFTACDIRKLSEAKVFAGTLKLETKGMAETERPKKALELVFSNFTNTLALLTKDPDSFLRSLARGIKHFPLFGKIAFRPFSLENFMQGDVDKSVSSDKLIETYSMNQPLNTAWMHILRDYAKNQRVRVAVKPEGLPQLSLAEVIVGAIVDELKTRGVSTEELKKTEELLLAPFKVVEIVKVEPPKPKNIPLEMSWNASHLVKIFSDRRDDLAADAQKYDQFGKVIKDTDFNFNVARAFVSLESLPEKSLPKNSEKEGRFILAAKYVSGIERVREAYNNSTDNSLKQELGLLLSDQNISRLVHYSGLNNDFTKIEAPKPVNKSPEISIAAVRFLLENDAVFLLEAHKGNAKGLKQLAEGAKQVSLSDSAYIYNFADHAMTAAALETVKVR